MEHTLIFGAQKISKSPVVFRSTETFFYFIIIVHLFFRYNRPPSFPPPSPTPTFPPPSLNSTPPTQSVEYPRHHLPYYILSLQWPQSFCFNHVHVVCRNPIPNHFTIHGLWPLIEPFPCVGEELTMTHLSQQGLLQKMRTNWPNLLYTPQRFDPDFRFWEREWNVHGKCTDLHPIQYFASAVTKGRYYINLFAETRRIIPGNQPYTFDFLYQRFKGVIQTDFRIKCNRTPNAMHHQLLELHICLDRYMRPTPCFPPFNIDCGLHQIFYSPLP